MDIKNLQILDGGKALTDNAKANANIVKEGQDADQVFAQMLQVSEDGTTTGNQDLELLKGQLSDKANALTKKTTDQESSIKTSDILESLKAKQNTNTQVVVQSNTPTIQSNAKELDVVNNMPVKGETKKDISDIVSQIGADESPTLSKEAKLVTQENNLDLVKIKVADEGKSVSMKTSQLVGQEQKGNLKPVELQVKEQLNTSVSPLEVQQYQKQAVKMNNMPTTKVFGQKTAQTNKSAIKNLDTDIVLAQESDINIVKNKKHGLKIPQAYTSNESKSLFADKPQLSGKVNNFGLNAEIDQFSRNMEMPEQIQSEAVQVQSAGKLTPNMITTPNKVFQLESLHSSENQSSVIDQVSNYIVQAKEASRDSVEMTFRHQDLGKVDLMVQKMKSADNVQVTITSQSQEAMKFFDGNRSQLLQTLTNAGIQVSELKLDSSSQMDRSNDFLSKNGQGQKESQMNDRDKRNQDQQRREELWSLFNEREAA